ncbi:helix-turn-helix domain-containing protein [Alteribacter aurantiacus]|uniref:helix-turn-helix domain-containing protein n=1 Tax=Alteribacter aurantiacus TaxID=254410 RepID=UPI000421BF1C|nr:helix-turn-helix domain-containing protein [Alteribacter aurantiacus]
MDGQKWLILTIIQKFGGQRSINGVMYLLQGRRSSQVIQDASLFYVLPLTASLKHRSKEELDKVRKELLKGNAYIVNNDGKVSLTPYGIEMLNEYNRRFSIPPHYNGGKYELNDEAEWFWQRLSLFIQSLSFRLKTKSPFIPIQYDTGVQDWVKKHFPPASQREKMAHGLYCEIFHLLKEIRDREATLFVSRLTSWNRTGLTIDQLTKKNDDPLLTSLSFRSVLHYMISQVGQDRGKYPYLRVFLKESKQTVLVTKTAQETYFWLTKGYTLEEISHKRKLKKSTIEDHIIEIVLFMPEVNAERFVDRHILDYVLNVAEDLKTQKLKAIKDALGNEYDYFTIRVALASREERVKKG